MRPDDIAEDLGRETKRALREAAPWLVWFGRFGFACKGAVYTLIGVLAALAAIGAGGETMGKKGALAHVAQAPFGRILLIALAAGIAGYALWRFIQSVMDTENKGSGPKGIAVRAGYFGIGLIYAGLAISALALVVGADHGADDPTPGRAARLMAQPFGRWLLAAVGVVVIAYAGRQFYRAYTGKFREKLMLARMSATQQTWACRLGRMGYAARAVVFGLIGIFLIAAGVYADPDEAHGLGGALDALARHRSGWIALAAVSLGLIAYGLYMFVEARYRRMVVT